MKSQQDSSRRAVDYQVGQWVWLRLLHRPVASLNLHGRGKLGPRYYGPYRIAERIGNVAYRLELPAGAKLHNVFHVGLLKAYHGQVPQSPPPLPPVKHGQICPEPGAVLKSRLVQGQHELLIHWKGRAAADASWMTLQEFRRLYLSVQLEDELLVQGGRDVMWGLKYERRKKKIAAQESG